jgi:hypothetical protein
MSLDVVSTEYAISQGHHEENGIMTSVVGNIFLFIGVKIIGSLFIIYILSKVIKMNKNYAKIGMRLIIGLMLVVVLGNGLVVFGSAIDNTFYDPTCLKPSLDFDHPGFLITNNNATTGAIETTISIGGYFSYNYRLTDGIIISCAVPDPSVAGNLSYQTRIFAVDGNGNVFYFDSPIVSFTNGFYHPANNPTSGIIRIGTITPLSYGIEAIAVDTNGNAYAVDGLNIIKYQKNFEYTQSIFHTIVPGIDYTVPTSVGSYPVSLSYVSDMSFNPDGTLNVIISGAVSRGSGSGALGVSLDRLVLDVNGNNIKVDRLYNGVSCSVNSPSEICSIRAFIIPDTTNYMANYTYAVSIILPNAGTTSYIKHNSSNGTVDIFGGALTGITSIAGMGYNNSQIYIASTPQNLIRSYITNYTGYVISKNAVNPQSGLVTYVSDTITVPAPTYYNNSKIPINWNLNFGINFTTKDNYLPLLAWQVWVTDPNGAISNIHTIQVFCDQVIPWWDIGGIITGTFGANSWYCVNRNDDSGLVYSPAASWINGTYTVSLIESYLGSNAVLATDTYIVISSSNPNSGGITISNPGGGSLSPGNQSNTGNPTMDNIANFLQMPAFWGILISVFCVVMVAWKAPSAVGIVALILSNLEAIIGLWAPYTIYVFIVTWIIAAIFFTLGRNVTTGGDTHS